MGSAPVFTSFHAVTRTGFEGRSVFCTKVQGVMLVYYVDESLLTSKMTEPNLITGCVVSEN